MRLQHERIGNCGDDHGNMLQNRKNKRMTNTRLDKDEYYLRVARLIKERGTCARRQVGCVLVDEHFHIIGTGYNGNARGTPHCIEVPCEGAQYGSGQGLDKCEAIHAEQNALLQCSDVMRIYRAYTTTLPCVHCMKLLMNTSVQSIYYSETYPHSSKIEALAQQRGIELVHVPLDAQSSLA
jgi:dCMP deaminase